MDVDVVMAQADARVFRAEARAAKAKLETATDRLKVKNLITFRLAHGIDLRRAIVEGIEGMARGRACPHVDEKKRLDVWTCTPSSHPLDTLPMARRRLIPCVNLNILRFLALSRSVSVHSSVLAIRVSARRTQASAQASRSFA